jgi:hypothetical protein
MAKNKEAAPKAAKKAAPPRKAAAPKATKERKPRSNGNGGGESRGRPSPFAGMRLYSTQEENPRRKDSLGYKSHEIVRKNPGIYFEDYILKGGRSKDLTYDYTRKLTRTESE